MFLCLGHESVGVCLGRGGDRCEGCRSGCVCADSCRWIDILEEAQRDGGNGDGTLIVPLDECIVKLFSGSEGKKIPWVSAIVDVL